MRRKWKALAQFVRKRPALSVTVNSFQPGPNVSLRFIAVLIVGFGGSMLYTRTNVAQHLSDCPGQQQIFLLESWAGLWCMWSLGCIDPEHALSVNPIINVARTMRWNYDPMMLACCMNYCPGLEVILSSNNSIRPLTISLLVRRCKDIWSFP